MQILTHEALAKGDRVDGAGSAVIAIARAHRRERARGILPVVGASRKHGRIAVLFRIVQHRQPAHYARSLAVERERLLTLRSRSGVDRRPIEEAALDIGPEYVTRKLHQLFGEHRIRQASRPVISCEQR